MCLSPITIKVDNYEGVHSIQVPCGKCVECLKTKQNDYMVRIYEEMMQVPKSCFVTLTYRENTVPYLVRDGKRFNVVWKQDVKDWIKRLRTNYERKTGIKGLRLFLCSEYGPRTHRPHYHAIFFNMSYADLKPALEDWHERFGYYLAKDIKYSSDSLQKSARYVSKYACKGVFEDPFRFASYVTKTFSPFFKRAWFKLCESNEIVPFVFAICTIPDVPSFNRLYKYAGWSWKVFRTSLFGRSS